MDSLTVATTRLLCRPEIGRALNFLFQDQLPTRGIIAFTRSAAVSDSTRAEVFFGIHERQLRRMVERYFRGDLDTVEIGAGIGVISARLGQRLSSARRLVCVEADPELAPLIEQNVAINAPMTRLDVFQGEMPLSEVLERADIAGDFALVVHKTGVVAPPRCRQVIDPRGTR